MLNGFCAQQLHEIGPVLYGYCGKLRIVLLHQLVYPLATAACPANNSRLQETRMILEQIYTWFDFLNTNPAYVRMATGRVMHAVIARLPVFVLKEIRVDHYWGKS